MLRKLLLFLPLLLLLDGCSTINSLSTTEAVIIDTTVQFATATYITKVGTTPALQLARAQKVKAIALEIQGIDSGTVSIAQLEATVIADIAKLTPAEQILANGLLTIIVDQLGVQVQRGVLSAAIAAEVNVVMNDVLVVCKSFGA